MKRLSIMILLALFAAILIIGTLSAQPMGPGQGGYCPWMGQGPAGQKGGWYCPWMGGSQTGPPVAKPGQPLTADQAKAMVEQHISGNPNLKVGKVTPKNDAYEVDIVTKDDSLVDKIQVNKQTGWFRSAY
ncbi:MAG: PepSY domain-containing protein [Deltaproteobacteria bacterium]|nr:PepSY domain-containing protein [Deltaproteobacteria bacterium]